MTVCFNKIDEFSNGKVEFYSVTLNENDLCEFEYFDAEEFPHHQSEIQQLYNIIYEIMDRGAKPYYFKFEGNISAMPFVDEQTKKENLDDYGIRLYCIRIGYDKVVLLNGGVKTVRDPEQCPNVNQHFKVGNRIGKALDKAIEEREIKITETGSLDQFTIEI